MRLRVLRAEHCERELKPGAIRKRRGGSICNSESPRQEHTPADDTRLGQSRPDSAVAGAQMESGIYSDRSRSIPPVTYIYDSSITLAA
jgi:hypothetical protein